MNRFVLALLKYGPFTMVDDQKEGGKVMDVTKKKIVVVKFVYWFGIVADAVWAVGLFIPQVFGMLTGNPDFNPDLQTRQIMGIGGTLMTGWTLLLLWAVQRPIERRGVLLLTAFPVIFGLFAVAFIGFINGDTVNIWIMVKTSILFISVLTSYVLCRGLVGRSTSNGKEVFTV